MTSDELTQELFWNPEIVGTVPEGWSRIVVGGMGGSALPGDAARFLEMKLPIAVHRDYDLPEDIDESALCIAISHSGNTEETLSFAETARTHGHKLAVITSGGSLAEFAKANDLPHVLVPGGMQPRNALFFQTKALLALIGRNDLAESFSSVSLDVAGAEQAGAELAKKLSGSLPVFYASRPNRFLAQVGKIMCNETAKMPSYANVFPEMNHNEMQSLDAGAPEAVVSVMRLVLLRDPEVDARVQKRMDTFVELMKEQNRTTIDVEVSGTGRAERLVYVWYVLACAATALAKERNLDPDAIPLVEEFKKRIA